MKSLMSLNRFEAFSDGVFAIAMTDSHLSRQLFQEYFAHCAVGILERAVWVSVKLSPKQYISTIIEE